MARGVPTLNAGSLSPALMSITELSFWWTQALIVLACTQGTRVEHGYLLNNWERAWNPAG